ncbi:MAG: DUF6249 domain-containing protein [Casimicrobiaceae bacterium]
MSSQIVVVRTALELACTALVAAALCLGAGPSTAAGKASGGPDTAKSSPTPAPAAMAAPTVKAADEPDAAASDTETAADEPDKITGPGMHHRAHIQIDDFDSFKRAMDVAPWIVGVVFLVLGSIFLTPIILLVGIIWYKLRKTRMQNEAVLKLAEKGVMPSAQAVDAVVSGTPPPQAVPAAAGSAVSQVVASRRRAVWSDLRKGILMIAIGVALSFYSMTENAEPNWIGLVLLFVGIGYVALWWLEDRHLERRPAGGPPGNGNA